MKRFGTVQNRESRSSQEDVFSLRLHLLLVMVTAALKGYPMGEFRKKAALDNAAVVNHLISQIDLSFFNLDSSTHLFRERVKLLSVMAAAIFSEDYPLGVHRREAVFENIKVISDYAFPNSDLALFPEVLKVA